MEFKYFVIRRLLLIIPTFLGLVLLVFLIMRSFPTAQLVAAYINRKLAIPVSVQIQMAKAQLGLDYPVPVQYFYYIGALFRGDWGTMNLQNYYTGPVLQGIAYFFPNTIQLAIFATILSVLIALPLGTYIGSRPNSVSDQAGRIFSLTGYAMPAFWLGLLLQIGLGRGVISGNPVGVFPISFPYSVNLINFLNPPAWINTSLGISYPTHIMLFDALIHGDFPLAFSALMHLVLPVLTLTYGILAGLLRFIRAGMVDSSNQEYVKTARSKGVPEKVIIKRHIRKNGLIPTLTVVGLLFASLLGGVVLIEDVFNYKGLGLLALNSVLDSSIYGVAGTTLVFGLILMVTNLVVDILYALYDPRIRY
ncbi:MAG TPA: ABC transporter permease [Thermoplasmataceae archaeon]|nr:ABC transporter permease [Thermoplasmatales archaeon AK]HLH85708.1 ABC transporter permease [Thermoplasmataceae archaeon]